MTAVFKAIYEAFQIVSLCLFFFFLFISPLLPPTALHSPLPLPLMVLSNLIIIAFGFLLIPVYMVIARDNNGTKLSQSELLSIARE